MHNIVIIGTGPAGLTAAIYAARAGLKPVIYAGLQHGGQLTTTTEVENFPGFANGIMGQKLMQEMTAQAERVGTKFIYSEINKVDFSQSPLKLYSGDQEIITKAAIISTGAEARTLKLDNEDKLMGRGLSTCATCDGFFYRNKTVAVIGGGDSAMEESIYLANICKEVILIHRRNEFRASKIMSDRAQKHPKIKIMTPWTIEELLHNDSGLIGAKLINTASGAKQDLTVDGLFYAIGHTPNSKIFSNYVDLDENQYIKTTNFTQTKTQGVFAAGDIADPTFKQAITAAGMGCQAAMQAAKYIESLEE
jgi:thioredoxin reductase (NADPH)